jgi:ABC-2 type transport system ATP-binding protein
MAGVLRELAQAGATVVFSSHQLDLVEDVCDEVAIIDQGRVVLAGAVRALKQRGSPGSLWRSRGAIRTGTRGYPPRPWNGLIGAESG